MEKKPELSDAAQTDLAEEDILKAMSEVSGYLDITPGDFKEIYTLAYRHAMERLNRTVTAGEIMTRDVIHVTVDTPLAEVAEAMGQRGISGVPVLDGTGKVVGIISEKDFLAQMGVTEPMNFMALVARCLKSKGCVALPIKRQKAADIMSSPAFTVSSDTHLQVIAALFLRHHINRVAVTDSQGRLQGIVSRGDLIKAGAICQGQP